jgi:hypothetical protein
MANDDRFSNINTTEIHRQNFPSADILKKKIYERNFNKALSIIHPRLEQIDLTNPYVRIMKSDFHIPSQPLAPGAYQIPAPCAYQIPEVVLTDVMIFLLEKGYRIVDIEDSLCNHIGWRISF